MTPSMPFATAPSSRFGHWPAVWLLIGVLAGLYSQRLFSLELVYVGIVGGGLLWLFSERTRGPGLVLLGFALAQWHTGSVMSHTLPADWDRRDARIIGTVLDLPQQSPEGARWQVRVDDAPLPLLRGQIIRAMWYLPKEPSPAEIAFARQVHVGQRWQLPVQLRAPRSLINPGVLDTERSAFSQRIVAMARVRNIETSRLLGASPGSHLGAWREQMSARIDQKVGRGESRFIRALALGDTRWILDADWTVLRNDGLTHLIAISGSHVGFVGAMFAALAWLWVRWYSPILRWAPRPIVMACVAGAGGLLYAVVTGAEAPTVRTALMMATVAIALVVRRRIEPLDLLGTVAMWMVLWDPLVVMGAGFWLSFLGVGWLMAVMPQQRESAPTTFFRTQFVATFALMPIAVLLFGQVSVAGSLANWVAVPFWGGVVVPLSLLGTGLETLVPGSGAWAWSAAAWCFGLTWPPFVALSQLEVAMVWVPQLSMPALGLACGAAWWLSLPSAMPLRVMGAVALLPMLWPVVDAPAPGQVVVRVLDVGQGLAVHVQTRSHHLMYDAGPARPGARDEGELTVVPYLHAQGVRTLDRLLISHGDNDHAGGAIAVQNAIRTLGTWAPEGAGVRHQQACYRGQHWDWDGVSFSVLWPLPGSPYIANDSSCVVRIGTRQGALLLTGDIGADVERQLLELDRDALRAQVVTVPHHGSETSSTHAFIRAVGARWALAGTGFKNSFRHPRPGVVARWRAAGAQFLETATGGAAEVRYGQNGWSVEQMRLTRSRLWDAQRHRLQSAHTVSYSDDRSGIQFSMDHISAASRDR